MLKHRVISALVLVSLVIYAIFFSSLTFFKYFVIAFGVIAICEVASFSKDKYKKMLVLILSLTFSVFTYFYIDKISLSKLLLFAWTCAFSSIFFYPKFTKIWKNPIWISLFCAVVITGFVRSVFDYKSIDEGSGLLLLYVLFLCFCTDIGAYFTGKKFGKNKMAKHISPGKTVEGLLGGIVSAILCATIFRVFFPYGMGLGNLALAFAISIISVLGDLFESMIKRIYGVKDSSNIIPGHGGVLDRLDSLLPALPLYMVFISLN